MRPLALSLLAMLIPVPPPVLANAREGSLWVGGSGLQVRLVQSGNDITIRAEHAGIFSDWFSSVSSGELLLTGRRSGDEFVGEARVFSPGCMFRYPVRGRWYDDGTRLTWSGAEPVAKARDSCAVTRSKFTTTTVRLKSSPPPAPPWVPPVQILPVNKSPPQRPRDPEPTPMTQLDWPTGLPTIAALIGIGTVLAVAVTFVLRLAYLKAMAVLAAARLALEEKRSHIAKVAPPTPAALSLSEITEVIEVLNLEADVRTTILTALAARIEEKG